jgi:iron complex transport system ATP-binding protein
MSTLATTKLVLGYDGAAIIDGLDVRIPAGQITALIGPNGCGKSTLLRGLARLLKPRGGAVYLDGTAITKLPTKELARQLGILPQSPVAPEGLTVRDLVAQGRYPHQRWFQQWSREDEEMTQRALQITNMIELADRPVDALSGGQRQRAWIAMTLAQHTATLLLDEPTTFLDMAHQIEVLHLLHDLNRRAGRTIVMVLHDLNHAARYADYVIAMAAGRIVSQGSPQEVVTPAMLRDVFGVEAEIIADPRTGAPLCIPYGLYVPVAEQLEPIAIEQCATYVSA